VTDRLEVPDFIWRILFDPETAKRPPGFAAHLYRRRPDLRPEIQMIANRHFHVSMPEGGAEVYHLRRDPKQATPDYTVTTIGEMYPLVEFGHSAQKGCCPYVEHNGRHLLPQHRRPAS
jgi:hypothetical protein